MTVPLTGAGSFGVRCGHVIGRWLDVVALMGGTATARVLSGASMVTGYGTIESDYNSGTASQQTIDNATGGIVRTVNSWQQAQNGFASALQKLLQQTVIDMVNLDVPLPSLDLTTALTVLINQMSNNSTTFNASVPSLGSQTSVGTPVGNAIVVGSAKDGSGVAIQYAPTETFYFKCTADSVSGGATAGLETLSVKGQAAAASAFAYNWPLGSGVGTSLSAVSGTTSNASGNLLFNSDPTTFSNVNLPDNWVALTGTVGTQILNGTGSNAYTTGGGSLEFAGDGSTLTAVYQPFNTPTSTGLGTGGTPAKLAPSSVYHYSCWIKVSATPAAGVLKIDLTDGTNTVVNDQAGTANTITQSLTGISTSFVNVSGAFRTPANLPSALRLRLRLSTAEDNGKNLYICRQTITKASQVAAGGPFFSVHSGNTNLLLADQWSMALTQTYGTFQREFERFFGMRALGLVFPNTASSPTVADSLVS